MTATALPAHLTCVVVGCERARWVRGICKPHHRRFRAAGTLAIWALPAYPSKHLFGDREGDEPSPERRREILADIEAMRDRKAAARARGEVERGDGRGAEERVAKVYRVRVT